MEHSFWHERWESGRIGFHQGKPNKLLLAHFHALGLADRSRVFLPLCGKTRDIAWLLSQGYRVAGAELSELAIRQLFEELEVEPVISNLGKLKRYSATDIEIFVGDVFSLTAELLGPVDAVFDRAALVALPEEMRACLCGPSRLSDAETAPQLLVCFEYDQRLQSGPPFSISRDEVRQRYSWRLRDPGTGTRKSGGRHEGHPRLGKRLAA
jgi:thiopurine S-methyltransferase